MKGTLKVSLCRAEGLPNVEWRATGGVQDPYCVLQVGDESYKSLVHDKGGTSPVWNQNFTFEGISLDKPLVVQIWDKNWWWRDVQIGTCKLPLHEVLQDAPANETMRFRLPVFRATGSGCEGKLDLDLQFMPLNGHPQLLQHQCSGMSNRSSLSGAGEWVSPTPPPLPPTAPTLPRPAAMPAPAAGAVGLAGLLAAEPANAPVPGFTPSAMASHISLRQRVSQQAAASAAAHPPQQALTAPRTSSGASSLPPTPSTLPSATPRGPTWILPPPYQDRDCKAEFRDWQLLGKNRAGATYRATRLANGERYAVKVLNKQRLDAEGQARVAKEVDMLTELQDHPNMVQLVDAWETRKQVCLVMELCSGGELFEALVQQQWGHYNERDAATLMRTIISLVADLHKVGIMHRDLKPENFLFSDSSKEATLKATGFATASHFKPGEALHDVVGSHLYVAPEVLHESYGPSADLWSCGCILYALLSGYTPYQGYSEEGVAYAIKHQPLDLTSEPWPAVSAAAKDCVRRLLEVDPAKRATAQDILRHEWLREGGVAGDAPLVLQGLQKFSGVNKLTKLALKITAACLPEHEKAGLLALFREMDEDGSGSVSAQELSEALRRKGQVLRRAEVERMMAAADLNGDKELDFEEFVAVMLSQEGLQQASLRNVFTQFDLDGNGTISVDEMRTALQAQGLGEEDIPRIIAEADCNGDCSIDYDEFCQMMQRI